MTPDLEVVQIGRAESFAAREHGYPYHTVRWHFHPEFELHHVVATSGRCFVGDYIGPFAPDNLILAGPNLPHNWISDIAPNTSVPLRCRLLQFSEAFVLDAIKLMPELASFLPMLALSRRGALFTPETGARIGPLLQDLVGASDIRRVELFVSILGILSRATDVKALSSADYHPDPSSFMAQGINEALQYINTNLTEDFGEKDLAAISRLSPSAFSRSFRRHTGMALGQYVNRLRINLASQMLMSEDGVSVTEVCFASGFRNVSNFNRQFLRQKGMQPSRFRAALAENSAFNHL